MSQTNYLDLMLAALISWLAWKHLLRPKHQKLKAKIKDYAKHLQHIYNMNNDIYKKDTNDLLLTEITACKDIRGSKDKIALSQFYSDSQNKIKEKLPAKKFESWADNLDVLLVAFSLAFAVRALFLQPFKIPTSSMQPTLHGMNLYNDSKPSYDKSPTQAEYLRDKYGFYISKDHGNLRAFLDSLYYGQQYANIIAKNSGSTLKRKPQGPYRIDGVSLKDTALKGHGVPLLESFTTIYIDNKAHTLPIPAQKLRSAINNTNILSNRYDKGDTIFHGVSEDGDHLFVNRLVYNFRNPKRGDISVFMTNGILNQDNSLTGQFYIKRLVGLPNETFRIRRDESGKGKIFKVIDGREIVLSEKDHPAFKKLYSGKNGYHGHSPAYGRKPYIVANVNQDQISIYGQGGNETGQFSKIGDKYVSITSPTPKSTQPAWYLHNMRISNDQVILFTESEEVTFTKSGFSYVLTDIIRKDGYKAHYGADYDEYTLGDNQFFMMGDNTNSSLDSRYWGPVPRKNLIGTAAAVFWPFSHRWGLADSNKLKGITTTLDGKY